MSQTYVSTEAETFNISPNIWDPPTYESSILVAPFSRHELFITTSSHTSPSAGLDGIFPLFFKCILIKVFDILLIILIDL